MTAQTTATSPSLLAEGVSRSFGGVYGARDVTLRVQGGMVVALIGPNGAGKSTALNCISGVDRPTKGRVWMNGEDVTDLSVESRARKGMGRTFQAQRLFASLSVAENIALPLASTWLSRLAGGPPRRESASVPEEQVATALDRVGMAGLGGAPVDTLTAGQRRLAEIARLIAMDQQVLLLDEPAAGLNSAEAERLFDLVQELASEGRAVLLVEHRIRSVLRIADHLVVMDHGQIIAEGEPLDVMNDQQVRDAYLGRASNA